MFTYWTNPPKPFLPGWRYAPVPGWGSNPAVAGPARVGVGNAVIDPGKFSRAMVAVKLPNGEEAAVPPPEPYVPEEGFPWLYVVAGTLVLGAGAAFAYNMGWLKL
jgi:hypothetical protein